MRGRAGVETSCDYLQDLKSLKKTIQQYIYIYHIDQWNKELKLRQHGVYTQPCLLKIIDMLKVI